ncbi:hypothetical protein G9C85_13805 [Halorubellus sp. JP-L1]|uniref:DUF7344 domain-containing protein n=1 Tax=Halorubellus sp. JP-L1 TaxID=2715753 RepID=UPI001408A929|nr:hypothetical protein [Halorubellus sp. JP-L1]NHN42696.1 hypothetical protein [Halorubellus sp. JP-L1]
MPAPDDDPARFERIPPDDSPFEDLRDVLSDPYGRAAVTYLYRTGGTVDLDDLARGCVALLDDSEPEDVGEESVRRVRTWLHHGHLPTLEAYGVVDYDPDADTVRLFQRDRP